MTDKPEFDLAVVIDDDEDILTAATLLLRRMFAEVLTAPNPQAALETLGGRLPDVVLLDANFARGATDAAEGLAWLGRLLAYDPDMAVVMITAHAGLQVAVAAMRSEEHTSELQSLMRISYAVFCLKKKITV